MDGISWQIIGWTSSICGTLLLGVFIDAIRAKLKERKSANH